SAPEWTNIGTVTATGGGTVTAAVAPTNLAGGTLTGGTWNVHASSTLRLPTAITTNNATLRLQGGSSNIYVGTSGTADALAGLTPNAASGELTVAGGRVLTPPTNLTNAGRLVVEAGSSLSVVDPLVSKWSGENNALDATGRNNGTLLNGTGFAPGQSGQAFSF